MEKSRAIELLKLAVPIKALTQQEYADFVEAVNMGMDALEAQLSCEGTTKDAISRQQALDAVGKYASIWMEYTDAMSKDEIAQIALNNAKSTMIRILKELPPAQPEPQWIPVSERLPSKEERKEWIDNNLDGIGYLYPCLVTRYSSINPDRTKNNPYVAKHYFDGEDFLNAGEEVCSEYIIAWMPLPDPPKGGDS